MSRKQTVINFGGFEAWEENRDEVDRIIKEDTGNDFYPQTRSIPPMIFGLELTEEAINKLNALNGVVVKIPDEE